MSATSAYQADVRARGWIYLPQLPGNTTLGRSVEGAPGARSPNTATVRSTFEVAPPLVRLEQGFTRAVDDFTAGANAAEFGAVTAMSDGLTRVAEAIGLDHGLGGVVAKGLGIPPWLLLILAVFVGYAVLRQYRVVPPLSDLV